MVDGCLPIQPTEIKRLFFPTNKATIIETAVRSCCVGGGGIVFHFIQEGLGCAIGVGLDELVRGDM